MSPAILVRVPSQLRGYTSGRPEVLAHGATLDAVIHDLERQFPGFRFRILDERDRVRQHILLFIGQDRCEDLATPMRPGAAVQIVGALSGG